MFTQGHKEVTGVQRTVNPKVQLHLHPQQGVVNESNNNLLLEPLAFYREPLFRNNPEKSIFTDEGDIFLI